MLESDIAEADTLLPKMLKTIPGTLQLHQVTWSCEQPKKIFLRQLSCTECTLTAICPHFPSEKGYFDYSQTAREVTKRIPR